MVGMWAAGSAGVAVMALTVSLLLVMLFTSRMAPARSGTVTASVTAGPDPGFGYLGAMRMAPSRRMTSPLSMGFSRMWRTRAAYSVGRPRREGDGTWGPRDSRTGWGR